MSSHRWSGKRVMSCPANTLSDRQIALMRRTLDYCRANPDSGNARLRRLSGRRAKTRTLANLATRFHNDRMGERYPDIIEAERPHLEAELLVDLGLKVSIPDDPERVQQLIAMAHQAADALRLFLRD